MADFENYRAAGKGVPTVQVEEGGEFRDIPWGTPAVPQPRTQPGRTTGRRTTSQPQPQPQPQPQAQEIENPQFAPNNDEYEYEDRPPLRWRMPQLQFGSMETAISLLRWFGIFWAIALSTIGLRIVALLIAREDTSFQVFAAVLASPRLIYFLSLMLSLWNNQIFSICHNKTSRIAQIVQQGEFGTLIAASALARWFSFAQAGLLISCLLAAPERAMNLGFLTAIMMAIAGVSHSCVLKAAKTSNYNNQGGQALESLSTGWTAVLNFAVVALFLSLRATAWISSLID